MAFKELLRRPQMGEYRFCWGEGVPKKPKHDALDHKALQKDSVC